MADPAPPAYLRILAQSRRKELSTRVITTQISLSGKMAPGTMIAAIGMIFEPSEAALFKGSGIAIAFARSLSRDPFVPSPSHLHSDNK